MEETKKTIEDTVAWLRGHTTTYLPNDWKKDLKCPGCGMSADRPKCAMDMGGSCPRHDPDEYAEENPGFDPYVTKPNQKYLDAADLLEGLQQVNNILRNRLQDELSHD